MQTLSAPPAADGVPHFAAFELASEGSSGVAEAIKELPGLMLAHVLRNPGERDRLITYWASLSTYALNRASVQKLAGSAAQATEGLVDVVVVPSVKWWKRVKLSTWILSAAALLGAVEAIADYFDHLFEPPQLMIKPDKSRFEALEGTQWQAHVAVINQLLKTEHRDVRLQATLAGADNKPVPVRILENELPTLAVGATRDIQIEGVAPPAGVYTLSLDVDAHAGWLRRGRSFPASALIVVFPKKPLSRVTLVESNATMARFNVDITMGNAAPKGLDCDLEIQGVPGLHYDHQISSYDLALSSDSMQSADSGADSDTVLHWSAGASTVHSAQVLFALSGLPGTDWKAVARATPVCRNRSE